MLNRIGEKYQTKNYGLIEIIEYINANEVKVRFIKTGYEKYAMMSNIRQGEVKDDYAYENEYVGCFFETTNSGKLEIIRRIDTRYFEVRFIDTGFVTRATMNHLKLGNVKDPLIPSVCGVGIVGTKYPVKLNGKHVRPYIIWRGMLVRCYDDNFKESRSSYKDCVSSDNFLYYEYFYEWYHNQIGHDAINFHLDKDVLVKGNKVYSEDTCCFVPREINSLFIKPSSNDKKTPIGVNKTRTNNYISQVSIANKRQHSITNNSVEESFNWYKTKKEEYIKFLANKWKGYIDPRVYDVLMNYEVTIND